MSPSLDTTQGVHPIESQGHLFGQDGFDLLCCLVHDKNERHSSRADSTDSESSTSPTLACQDDWKMTRLPHLDIFQSAIRRLCDAPFHKTRGVFSDVALLVVIAPNGKEDTILATASGVAATTKESIHT